MIIVQGVRHVHNKLRHAFLYLYCAKTLWPVSFHHWKNSRRLTHWKCEKCNCTPDATERTNALAGTAEWCGGIYGEKCYFTSSLYSSQMAWVKECTDRKQAKAKEGKEFKKLSLYLPFNDMLSVHFNLTLFTFQMWTMIIIFWSFAFLHWLKNSIKQPMKLLLLTSLNLQCVWKGSKLTW